MCQGECSKDNDVGTHMDVLPGVGDEEIFEMPSIVGWCESIPPRRGEPRRQGVENAGTQGDDFIRQRGPFQETSDHGRMRSVGGDIEWDEVGKVGCIY